MSTTTPSSGITWRRTQAGVSQRPTATTPPSTVPAKKDPMPIAPDFRTELESLINRHSKENGSNTPDFMLADYLVGCLENFDKITRLRDRWYNNRSLGGPGAREHGVVP